MSDKTSTDVAWEREYGSSKIKFVCHQSGEVYLSFDWNGSMVWEYVGAASTKRFPNFLRRVADEMEKKL
jgi:hypothetical protein